MVRRLRGDDRGSVLPLILGFFLIALLVVGGSVSLSQAFVQQQDLQDDCDGAAAAAAASAGDLDRGGPVVSGASLRFDNVRQAVDAYFARDPTRRDITYTADLTDDDRRITLRCRDTAQLAFGGLIGHPTLVHTVVSSARAAVVA